MEIKRFEWNYIKQVMEIEIESFKNDIWDELEFMKWYEKCSDGFLVAKENDKVIGYSVSELVEPNIGYIRNIAVRKRDWKKGIGKKLIQETIKRLKLKEIYLHVRTDNEALNFYKKLGFEEVQIFQGVYSDGGDAVYMKLKTGCI